jgi:hypothetical protein
MLDETLLKDLNLNKLNIKDLTLLLEIINEIEPKNSSKEEIEVI